MEFKKESLADFLARGGRVTKVQPGGDGVVKPAWKKGYTIRRYRKVGDKLLPNKFRKAEPFEPLKVK